MAHSVISGVGHAVDGVGNVGKWTMESSMDLHKWITSATKQGHATRKGPQDWTGTYESQGFLPAKMPGDTFTFTGSYDGATGVVGPVMVDVVEIRWNQETGEPIGHTVSFSGTGLPVPGAAVAADASVPVVHSSVGLIIKASDASAAESFVEILDVRSVTLTISRANTPYTSSSTVTSGQAYVGRLAGPWDFSLSYSVFEGDPSILLTPGDVYHFQVYVTAALFWDLKWARISELSDVDADSEGAIMGATQNAEMEGYTEVEAATVLTEGYIKTPEAVPVTVWPVP